VAATLYAVPASHPCACVERALQLKRISYRRIDVPPVTQKLTSKLLFGAGTVPGLVLDGQRILGSRPIIRALEAKAPEPRLLPADEKERKSVELAEEWGDEVLQPLVRRVLWLALRRAPAAILSYSEGSKLFVPPPIARLSAPLVARAGQRVNAATELNVRADLAHLEGHLARGDRWIDHDVIGGEAPNAADLQIGSGLRLLLTVEDVAAFAGSRPATELARKWFPDYPGHTPAGTLPAEWLPSSE
jgi:glutathione S-transferase